MTEETKAAIIDRGIERACRVYTFKIQEAYDCPEDADFIREQAVKDLKADIARVMARVDRTTTHTNSKT